LFSQITVSITVSSSKRSDIIYSWMTSIIYREAIWLCVFLLREVQVHLWMLWCGNIVHLKTEFLGVITFTTPNLLSLIMSCKLSYPTVVLKTTSLHNFALKSSNKICIWYFLVKSVLSIITFTLSWCMHIQNNITSMTS
jgi:hypothetical protein